MENDIMNLSLKKKEEEIVKSMQTISDVKDASENVLGKYMTEEEIESIKQIVPPLPFNSYFEDFAKRVSESLNKISKLLSDAIECVNNSFLTTQSLADMFPANNKLKMQGKPMRRWRAYAKTKNKRRTKE